MKRAFFLGAALLMVASVATPAHAQRGGRGMVNTPYGKFTMGELQASGGDPAMAAQVRQQKQMTLEQQRMFKLQQQSMQQLARQKKAQQAAQKPQPAAPKTQAKADTTAATPKSAQTKNTTTGSATTKKSTVPHVPGAPD